ncbi:MAG: hypothetical protein ACOYMN_08315 [Roseimicrobium sp.]
MSTAILDAQAVLQSILELRKGAEDFREQQRKTDEQLRKTEELVRALSDESRKTDQQMRKTDDEIRRLTDLFTSQWGKLVEALVEPGSVQLFRARGLAVMRSARRLESRDAKGEPVEIDVLLEDGDTVVAIEVKTTCRPADVTWHLDKLARFKEAFPKLADCKVQGAMAALTYDSRADRLAYKSGLWVLKCVDGVTSIANDEQFVPRSY